MIAGAVASAGGAAGLAQQGITVSSTVDLLRSGQRVLGVLTEYADTGNTPRSLGVDAEPARVHRRPHVRRDPAAPRGQHGADRGQGRPAHAPGPGREPRRSGMQLNCAVDPSNPTRNVAIDWGDIPV